MVKNAFEVKRFQPYTIKNNIMHNAKVANACSSATAAAYPHNQIILATRPVIVVDYVSATHVTLGITSQERHHDTNTIKEVYSQHIVKISDLEDALVEIKKQQVRAAEQQDEVIEHTRRNLERQLRDLNASTEAPKTRKAR